MGSIAARLQISCLRCAGTFVCGLVYKYLHCYHPLTPVSYLQKNSFGFLLGKPFIGR
jgi:hypothetical protein